MSVSTDEKRRMLEATKLSVKTKYDSCTVAAKKLVRAYSVLLRAEDAREIKNNARVHTLHARAHSSFELLKVEYLSEYKQYEDLLDEVRAQYNDLIEAEDSPKAERKLVNELSKFESKAENNKASLSDRLIDVMPTLEEALSSMHKTAVEPFSEEKPAPEGERAEEAHREERREPYLPPHYAYPNMYHPSIAPASIDISGIVEDAVRVAMDKFVKVFEKRMSDYEAALPEVKSGASESATSVCDDAAAPSDPSVISELEAALVNEEERIVERLREVLSKLQGISASLSELGASAIELSGAVTELAEEEKRANDMQRRTARDIQGILVSQKLISEEVAGLVGLQAAAIEEQKANIENQKHISAAQSEIAEMERGIIEKGVAINESAKELVAQQKALVNQQTSILASVQKSADAQRELTEKQAELTAYQKSLEKEHKALAKRSKGAKQSTEKSSAGKTVTDEAEVIVESSTVPEEVDLDSIKNEE